LLIPAKDLFLGASSLASARETRSRAAKGSTGDVGGVCHGCDRYGQTNI
jgi:hypothetical protein